MTGLWYFAFCSFPHGPVSICSPFGEHINQVLYLSCDVTEMNISVTSHDRYRTWFFLIIQRYKLKWLLQYSELFTAKIKKGSNSVNTGDRVMVFCILQFPSWPCISVSSFIKLSSILLEIYSEHKYDRRTDSRPVHSEVSVCRISHYVCLFCHCGVKFALWG